MINIEREIKRLQEKNPELRRYIIGEGAYHEKIRVEHGWPLCGTVVDNKDPLGNGWVRVACDSIAPGAITPWIPVLAIGASKDSGWWQIPDIGTQVLMFFVGKGHSRPVVVGSLYDEKHRPPKHSTKNPADSLVYQTPNHRMEFIDKEGNESVIISTAKGQMRIELSKANGILLKNELGDIKIKCKKLKINGDDKVQIQGKKSVKISGKNINVKSSSSKIKSGGEISYNARNIKLHGSRGVTAEGRQIAAAANDVQGFDIHQMVVPSGTGTAVVPLPHPFLGKLDDKLSSDVKINNHNAATKGSVATHTNPVHNQLPGTIRFNNNPNRKGEVTGNTVRSVKINGKEAAVIGSTVTTCNDTGARDHSVVIAPGAHIPMPMIINPKNTEAWKKENERQQKHFEITDVRFDKPCVKEGEQIKITALVEGITDGNPITLQIWSQGQDPNSHIPLDKIIAVVKDNKAEAPYCYNLPKGAELPENDPAIFVTAHSPWCPPKQSGEFTVELKRPGYSVEFNDTDSNGTESGLIGKPVILVANCNEDTEEGAWLTFRVYREGDDPKRDRPVYETEAQNVGGTAKKEWLPAIKHDPENPLKEKPKFFFTANSQRCKEEKSWLIEVCAALRVYVYRTHDIPLKNTELRIKGHGDNSFTVTTDESGYFEKTDCIPQLYELEVAEQEKTWPLSTDKITKIILNDSMVLGSD